MAIPADQRCRRRPINVLLLWCVPLALMVLACGMVARGVQESTTDRAPVTEYEVKAALLLNFARFTEWPAQAFGDAESPIVIGILGDDPFGLVLERTLAGQTIRGRSLTILRSRQLEDFSAAHVLFVSLSERDRVCEILATFSDANILTVGEIDDFARKGGVVNFYFEHNTVRFEINAAAAKRKGLKLSSQLLRRARIVDPEPARRGE